MQFLKNKFKPETQPKTAAADTQKGFSLQNVVIASIIVTVLGGIALTQMWGSTDKAAIAAEAGSINNVKTAMAGVRQDNAGFPTLLDAATDTIVAERLSQMPKELKYQLVMMDGDGTAGGSDKYIALKATAIDNAGRDRLATIVADLDLRLDNGTADAAAGRFIYETTCSAPTTRATSETDCYYITPVMSKAAMPTSMAADEVYTDASTLSGATWDADITANANGTTAIN